MTPASIHTSSNPGTAAKVELNEAQKSALAAIEQAKAEGRDDDAARMRRDLSAYERVMGLPSAESIRSAETNEFWRWQRALTKTAPEMLSQLEWAESVLKCWIEGSAQIESLRATIAKAKGIEQ